MSTNSTSSPTSLPTNTSFSSLYSQCRMFIASNVIYTMLTCANIFLLFPFFTLILCMGFKRWRRQQSAPAGVTMNHSDFFTYQMMIVEILGVFGSVAYTLGNYIKSEAVLMLGVLLSSITLPGQTLFHVLTCVERYVAVVHPVAYMRLRDARGVRVRNRSTVCVWLLCVGWMGTTGWDFNAFPVWTLFSILVFCVFVIFFCCVSVLCVLIRPGPGDAGGNKERVDQSKKRAFQMMVAITASLLLRTVGLLFWYGVTDMPSIDLQGVCVLIDSGLWLMVPSSLVLPLLFLHRAGKLLCCRQTAQSG